MPPPSTPAPPWASFTSRGPLRTRSFLFALFLLAASPAAAQEGAQVGRQAPRFRLPVYNPKQVGAQLLGLDQFVGQGAKDLGTKVVLLSFTASFCGPCKKELPWLEQMHRRLQPEGLRVVVVSIDDTQELQQEMAKLVADHQITFPVLKDRTQLVVRRWLSSRGKEIALPSVFLIRPDGVISFAHVGYSEDVAKFLEAEVQAALGAP